MIKKRTDDSNNYMSFQDYLEIETHMFNMVEMCSLCSLSVEVYFNNTHAMASTSKHASLTRGATH